MTRYLIAVSDTRRRSDVGGLNQVVTNAAEKHVPELANENLPFEYKASARIVVNLGHWNDDDHFEEWFRNEVEDGEYKCEFEFDWHVLSKLRETCKRVLENTDLAGEVLPTRRRMSFDLGLDANEAENGRAYLAELQSMVDVVDKVEEMLVVTDVNGEQESVYDFVYTPFAPRAE